MPNTQELPVYVGEGEAPVRAVDHRAPPLRLERAELRHTLVEGRRIAYQDVGDVEARAVVLAHCSAGSHREWSTLVPRLDRYRVIAPDLIGYGSSERWPANATLPPMVDVRVLVTLAALSPRRIHLVGHSYGAAVALDAARVLGARVASLTLIEPVSFHLLRAAGRIGEWHEIHAVGEKIIRAMRNRRERAAAAAFMGYWIGRWSWWMMDPRARERTIAAMSKVAAEFEALDGRSSALGEYRDVYAPTRLVVGGRTRQPTRVIVEELLALLPAATVRVVPDAGHMSPVTHPREVNDLVMEHVDAIEQVTVERGVLDPTTLYHRRSTDAPLHR